MPPSAPPAEAISQGLPPILTSAVEGCAPAGGTPAGGAGGLSPDLDGLTSPEPVDVSIPSPAPDSPLPASDASTLSPAPPEVIEASHPPAPPAEPSAPPAGPATPGGAAPDDGISKMLAAQQALYGQGCATCLMSHALAAQHQASMAIIGNIG